LSWFGDSASLTIIKILVHNNHNLPKKSSRRCMGRSVIRIYSKNVE
jgi:hypothetical protein